MAKLYIIKKVITDFNIEFNQYDRDDDIDSFPLSEDMLWVPKMDEFDLTKDTISEDYLLNFSRGKSVLVLMRMIEYYKRKIPKEDRSDDIIQAYEILKSVVGKRFGIFDYKTKLFSGPVHITHI
jgi:hypothetical protein